MRKSEASEEREGWAPSRRELLARGISVAALALANIFSAGDSDAKAAKRRKPRPKAKTKKGRPTATRPRKKERQVARTPEGPLPGSALYSDLITYYNLGEHRTATDADLRTSDWLGRQLKAAGLKTEFQSFRVRQFFSRPSALDLAGMKLRVFPLWPPRGTGPAPIRARVVNLETGRDLRGAIAAVSFPFDARATILPSHIEKIGAAVKAGAVAVLAVTEGHTGDIIAFNTRPSLEQWRVPVALIAARDGAAVRAAASNGESASLLMEVREEQAAEARNVIGRLVRSNRLFVVSTPQSGWFRCGGERGPGIALFLALARWAKRSATETSFLFVSTSGHELGGLGMERFIKDLAPQPGRVMGWLHLGAGIATYEWEETDRGPHRLHSVDSRRRLMCGKDLIDLLTEPFSGLAGLTPATSQPVGEYEPISKAGYRAFAIAAASTFHHTPSDSPEMTGPEILEPVGTALVKSIEAIEAKFGASLR